MVAETTERVAEPRDATEVVAEPEIAKPRDSRKGNAKTRRQPRPPVMGAGEVYRGINMTAYEEVQFHNREADQQSRSLWLAKDGDNVLPPERCAGLLPAMTRWADERLAREAMKDAERMEGGDETHH